jgi:hypothetical protein
MIKTNLSKSKGKFHKTGQDRRVKPEPGVKVYLKPFHAGFRQYFGGGAISAGGGYFPNR